MMSKKVIILSTVVVVIIVILLYQATKKHSVFDFSPQKRSEIPVANSSFDEDSKIRIEESVQEPAEKVSIQQEVKIMYVQTVQDVRDSYINVKEEGNPGRRILRAIDAEGNERTYVFRHKNLIASNKESIDGTLISINYEKGKPYLHGEHIGNKKIFTYFSKGVPVRKDTYISGKLVNTQKIVAPTPN